MASGTQAADSSAKVAPVQTWTEWYNDKWVDWTAKNTSDCVKTKFSINAKDVDDTKADSTLKKVAKVFFMCLASIVLFPMAAIVHTGSWIKNCVWPEGKEDPKKDDGSKI